MNIFLAGLILVSSLFLSPRANAADPEYKVHLIYAGDQSASMRFSHKPSWMSAQQTFLAEYFANYHSRCQELHVDYVAWGSEALPPLRTVLRTHADGKEFSRLLQNLIFQNLEATVQHRGMMKAISLVTNDFDRTVIMFVSDEYIGGEHDAELWRLVPAHVEFIGISLGTDSVADYFKRHIVPPTENGHHYHANTTGEFETILYQVLDGLGFDHCQSS